MGEELVNWCGNKGGYIGLDSFWGGSEFKRCVQITIATNYVQMTYEDAKEFFRKCIKEIELIENRYNDNPPWWEEMHKSNQKETEE